MSVQVDDHAFVKEAPGTEDVMHDIHEGSWSICQAERHDCELKQPISGPEGCLGDVLVLDSNLVVPGAQVNLGKDCAALDSVKQFFNSGQRVPVLDCDFVQGPVIHTEPHAAILLLHEEHRGSIGGFAGSDEAMISMICKLFAELLKLCI